MVHSDKFAVFVCFGMSIAF